MEKVGFGQTGMAYGMKEVGFSLTVMAWNGGSRFCSDWNGLEWRKLVLAGLKCLGMAKVGFGLKTGMTKVGLACLGAHSPNAP
jgi:hypothetical protein